MALFFYAGHGLQVAAQNYIAPIDASLDAEGDLDFETVPVDLVLRADGARHQHQSGFPRCLPRQSAGRQSGPLDGDAIGDVGRGLARVGAGLGTLVAFATQPGNVALDGSGHQQPVHRGAAEAHRAARHRRGRAPDRCAPRRAAATNGAQVPWDQSSLTGRFYFSAKPGEPVSSDGPSSVAADYQLAERVGTKEAWEAFLAKHGGDKGNFYVQLAEAALRKLTTSQNVDSDCRRDSVFTD